MPANDYAARVRAYQDAVAALYAAPLSALGERGGADIAAVSAVELDHRAETMVERSRELGEAVAEARASADAAEREVAQLQLLAAAAIDLHVASDLVRRADAGVATDVVERGPVLPAAVAELQQILDADPSRGMQPILGITLERASGPADARAARAALATRVKDTIADIRDDAAEVGRAVFTDCLQVPAPALQSAAGVVLAEIMSKLSDAVSAIVRKAVRLVAQAIDKLLLALGGRVQGAVRGIVGEWIDELKTGTAMASLLDRLYQSDRIRDDVQKDIDGAPPTLGADRFNQASERLTELAARFRKHKQVITWLRRGLSWARPWIVAIEPSGTVGLAATYATTLGYVVYLGGDYVDWYRLGASDRLNLVSGVRTIVRQGLAATNSAGPTAGS